MEISTSGIAYAAAAAGSVLFTFGVIEAARADVPVKVNRSGPPLTLDGTQKDNSSSAGVGLGSEARTLWQTCDKHGKELLNRRPLVDFVPQCGLDLTDEEVRQLLNKFEQSGDFNRGGVSFEHFKTEADAMLETNRQSKGHFPEIERILDNIANESDGEGFTYNEITRGLEDGLKSKNTLASPSRSVGMADDEVERMREIFGEFSTNGVVSSDVARKIVNQLKTSLSDEEIAAMMKQLLRSSDGEISFDMLKEIIDDALMLAVDGISEERSLSPEPPEISESDESSFLEQKNVCMSEGPHDIEKLRTLTRAASAPLQNAQFSKGDYYLLCLISKAREYARRKAKEETRLEHLSTKVPRPKLKEQHDQHVANRKLLLTDIDSHLQKTHNSLTKVHPDLVALIHDG